MKEIFFYTISTFFVLKSLSYFNIYIPKSFEFTILFFVILSLKIELFTILLNWLKVDKFVTAFTFNVGFKFLFSFAFIFLAFHFNIYVDILDLAFFMFNYFVYTYLLAKFGVNKIL